MLEILKHYPKRSSLFVGFAIGLATNVISRRLCGLDQACVDGGANPFHQFALILGSVAVGIYSLVYVQSGIPIKTITFISVVLLTWLSVGDGGVRSFIPGDPGSPPTYMLAFGITSLVFIFAIELLAKGKD
ncbi:MAG: hypothetical protein AAFX95_07825 [Cyanobacteria bacterium J06639_16]